MLACDSEGTLKNRHDGMISYGESVAMDDLITYLSRYGDVGGRS